MAEGSKMMDYVWGNPAGLKLMQEMQAEAEPEPEITGEKIGSQAALNAKKAEFIANQLHALAQVPDEAPPSDIMFEKWSNWAA